MMSYEEFKKEVEKQFPRFFKGNYELMFNRVRKINQVSLDGIVVIKLEEEKKTVLYINDMYENYKASADFFMVLKEYAREALDIMEKVIVTTEKSIKENIYFQLIHTKENKEILVNTPHRTFLDLTIVYRWATRIDGEEIHSTLINHEFAKKYKLTEDELYRAAFKNTNRLFPSFVKGLSEILYGYSFDEEIYVISNCLGFCGASAILYPENLEKLAEKLQADLYILPSSIHEWLACSAKKMSPEALASIVHHVNHTEVMPKDRLSGSVYRYDRETKKISIAYDKKDIL